VSGIKIAIDDFGAGYSRSRSARMPFVELKLDASFVKNCATDATNAAICQTAIDLAHPSAVPRSRRALKTPLTCSVDGDGLRFRPGV
jgi:EAL domain-containing protein (putative c-di-GMP-specific phosphodiesterase class I)